MGCGSSLASMSDGFKDINNAPGSTSELEKKDEGYTTKMSVADDQETWRRTSRWQNVNLEQSMERLSLSCSIDEVKWWDKVDYLIAKDLPVIKPLSQRKTWKTVRLFISSTFKDMSSERELLVKTLVPSLRTWCSERKLRLIECDLRWGVPKDSDTRETLMSCLSEIDRCREENEYPYFLNMLSERYGSVMQPEEVPEDIKMRYKWMPGMSVTALEVFTGAYWDRNSNALFMMRKSDFLDGVQDPTIRKVYQDTDPDNVKSLQVLKGKIREKFPSQTHDYNCHVKQVENGKLVLGGLEHFIKTVREHFKACMERQYTSEFLNQEMTETEVARAEQEDFLTLRSRGVKGRDEVMSKITDYIHDDSSNCPMSIVGFAGAGKSSLLASSAKTLLTNDKFKVYFHFVGATPDSTSLYSMLSRFFHECMPPGSSPPLDPDEMIRFIPNMFDKSMEHAKSEGYSKIVAFMDALNQLDDEGTSCVHKLNWLPRTLPKGLKLIVSTLESETLIALRSHKIKCQEVQVEPLNKNYRTKLVKDYLEEYNKELDTEQMETLVNKRDAGRPLYLTISCEELRVFGEFRKLTDKVKNLPGDLTGVIEIVLKRVISEYGEDVVESTLCLIESSRFGLSERELLQLLAVTPLIPGRDLHDNVTFSGDQIQMAKWAFAYLGLNQFLRPCGGSGSGRLDFYHRTTSKVVRQSFLANEGLKKAYHKRLATYFHQCQDVGRKAEELPFHLMKIQDMSGLQELLVDKDFFLHMSQEKHKQQLMSYWQHLGGYEEAAKAYIKFQEDHISKHNLAGTDEGYSLQMQVVWFLIDIGQYDATFSLLQSVIKGLEKKHGRDARELADPLYAIMVAAYKKGLAYVYNTHPGYRESVAYGRNMGPWCEKVHRLYWSPDDNHLGQVLTICGYFNGKLLEECRRIFQKTKDMKGLAEVLFMMGEKSQYSDISVSEALFEQSLALCLAAYGRLHLKTARCYQLYGQLYWNQWSSTFRKTDWLKRCLSLYKTEVQILEEIQGKLHPNTVRSREDVIIILQNLGDHKQAAVYQKEQPADVQAV